MPPAARSTQAHASRKSSVTQGTPETASNSRVDPGRSAAFSAVGDPTVASSVHAGMCTRMSTEGATRQALAQHTPQAGKRLGRRIFMKLIIEDDEGRKTVVPLVREEITIGRQDGNTIKLSERNVSRRHARLKKDNGSLLIEDLGSYNGVRVNGERIARAAPGKGGDPIRIRDHQPGAPGAHRGPPPPPPPPPESRPPAPP